MRSSAPAYATDLNGDTIEAARAALGDLLTTAQDKVGEVSLFVRRDGIVEAMERLRTTPGLEYQQLMEIAGVDRPDRPERFEIVYMLLSLTRNHRIQVRVSTDEDTPVPSVTGIWPVAGWLEREVYDLYGVLFVGNDDLRRILTDYGFRGHPLRKDFPLTGYVELRYSEEAKRVVYEPVSLAQDLRNFDFLSPWEGAEYVLPGDEKGGAMPQAKGAQSPVTADQVQKAAASAAPSAAPPSTLAASTGGGGDKGDAGGGPAKDSKESGSTAQTGAGKPHPGDGPKPADPDVKPGGGGQNQ